MLWGEAVPDGSHEDQVEARCWGMPAPCGNPDSLGMPVPDGRWFGRSLAFRCRCVVFFDIFAFAPSCVAESSAAAERLLRFVRRSFLPTDVSTWHRDRYCVF